MKYDIFLGGIIIDLLDCTLIENGLHLNARTSVYWLGDSCPNCDLVFTRRVLFWMTTMWGLTNIWLTSLFIIRVINSSISPRLQNNYYLF